MRKIMMALAVSVLSLAGCVTTRQYKADIGEIALALQAQTTLDQSIVKAFDHMRNKTRDMERRITDLEIGSTQTLRALDERIDKIEDAARAQVKFGRDAWKPKIKVP